MVDRRTLLKRAAGLALAFTGSRSLPAADETVATVEALPTTAAVAGSSTIMSAPGGFAVPLTYAYALPVMPSVTLWRHGPDPARPGRMLAEEVHSIGG